MIILSKIIKIAEYALCKAYEYFPLIQVWNYLQIHCCVRKAMKTNEITRKAVIHTYKDLIYTAESFCYSDGKDVQIKVHYHQKKIGQLGANSTLPKTIWVTPVWIEKIAKQEFVWDLAFLQTIGHELAHKINEPEAIRKKVVKHNLLIGYVNVEQTFGGLTLF